MRVLSFDTSTSALHLCLLQDGKVAVEQEMSPSSENRQEVASLIMPQIDAAFKEAAWQRRDLSLIVVGIGPGSFTGIRVAVVTARTLAQALSVPVIGIASLEAAYYASGLTKPAAIIQGTTSKQFFFAAFDSLGGEPAHPVVRAACGAEELLVEQLNGVSPWLADATAARSLSTSKFEHRPLIKNLAKSQAQLALHRLSFKGLESGSPSSLAQLAEIYPWWEILPLYLRSPSVTLKKTYANPHPANEPR